MAGSQAKLEKMKLRQDYRNLWHSDLMGTVTADTPYCCISCLCGPCVSYMLRKRALYNDMSRYTCCAGYMPCSGRCGESKCPQLCLATEVFLCFGNSVASTRFLLQDEFNIQTTKCDNCIIGFMFCLSQVACIFSIVACLVGSDELSEASQILSCCADMVYCTVCACMQTQHKLEMDKRDGVFGSQPMGVPPAQQMSVLINPSLLQSDTLSPIHRLPKDTLMHLTRLQVTEGRGIEYNSSNSLMANLGVTRVLREERPSSKIVTITSFSVIKGRGEPYESSVFEAAGYKWRLVLYVNGNPNDGGNDHISLYARIEESDSLPIGWEVNVDLKLFVHNGKLHKYLTVTDGTVKRYNNAKKEWGFGQLIALPTFYNTNEGYIEQDTGSFGAEIFIVKPPQQQEKVTFISNPPNNIFTWKILHFSTLEDKFYYSDDFLVEDRYWRLGFNPKGDGGGRPHALPIFLFAQGHKANAVATNTWGAVNLRLKNQRSNNHKQIYSAAWYPIRSGYGVGVNNIILLGDLNDASKGYLVNDAIIFEAEMVKVSVTNIVSV